MIKKIITLLLIAIFSFSSTFAYTKQELQNKTNNYKKIIKKKFADKLEKISEKKLKKILILINKYIEKYKNKKNILNTKKLKNIAILTAFREIISEKLEDEYWDIVSIFWEVNKKVEIIIITDKRCGDDCNTDMVIEKLKEIPDLENTKIKKLDYDEEEAKDLMKKNNIKYLPIVIVSDDSITELKNYLIKWEDNKYLLNIWGSFDPVTYDKLLLRKETPKTLDIFVMWYCPFGEIALKTLPEMKDRFKDIKIDIHYIAWKIWSGNTINDFNSLHWKAEVEEDMRQLCIKKNYWIDKVIEYWVERYKNANNYGIVSDKPEDSMKVVKIDLKKIEACISSWEAGKLLEEDIKIAQELDINASPTWFANNRYKFLWIFIQNIHKNFCKYNSNLKACKEKIKIDKKGIWTNPTCN